MTVIVSYFSLRAWCTLYKEILDLLNDESISGVHNGRASLHNLMKSLPRVFEKVSRLLKCHLNFFVTYIYISVADPGVVRWVWTNPP